MSAKTYALGAVVSFVLLSGGCPMTGDGGNGGPAATAGTWIGTLNCSTVQTLGDTEGTPRSSSKSFSITFNDAGVPTSVTVFGFSGNPDVTVAIAQRGESATATSSSSTLTTITQVVTVTASTIDSDSVSISLSIDYDAAGGSLTQEGSGTLVITATLSGGNLTYTAESDFDVTQIAGDIRLETGERVSCTGTLTLQP